MTVFYDRNWIAQPFTVYLPLGIPIARPEALDQMMALAETLCGSLSFARIDLYLVDDTKIVFGEITLTSWAGWESFHPREYDFRLGSLWH